MKANKFSGTGGLQHWLCASATVVKALCSSSPLLSLLLVAPGRGTLLPENPTLGSRNLPLLCSKISQRQQTPSPFPPRIRALALSQITLPRREGWQIRQRRHQCRRTDHALAMPCALVTVTCAGPSYSAELWSSASSHSLCKILDRQGKGTACFRTRCS